MKEDFNTIYIRENLSKIEFYNIKEILKKVNKIKNNKIRMIIIKILKVYIHINFYITFFTQKIKEDKINNGVLCIIPILNIKNYSINKLVQNILIKRIRKVIIDNKIGYIIISKEIKKNESLRKKLEELNLNKYKGKYILKVMILDIIKYIVDIRKENIENQSIYILVNQYNKFNLELINYICNKVKSIYIVTNEVKKFQKLEKSLYEEQGIMIAITNNKEKSLKRAKIIYNIDFTEEDLLKYKLNRNCIIINSNDEKIEIAKGFNGVLINSVIIKEINYDNFFDYSDILESYIANSQGKKDLNEVVSNMKNKNANIDYLIGERGKIENIEYIKCLTNY